MKISINSVIDRKFTNICNNNNKIFYYYKTRIFHKEMNEIYFSNTLFNIMKRAIESLKITIEILQF